MQTSNNRALVLEIADALLGSWWTVVAGVLLGLAGSYVALNNMDREYEATVSMLVMPQRISQDLIESTVTEELTRRVLALREIVLGEEYMKELIRRTYGGLPDDPAELERRIRSIRNRVTVTTPETRRIDLVAFDVTFHDSRPERAAAVVNTLAELYIEQNTDSRTSAARDTTRTLAARAEKAKAEFEDVDERLSKFVAAHRFDTQEHLDANLRVLDSRQRDLEDNLNRQSVVQDSLTKLQQQLADLERPMPPGTDPTAERLRSELEALLVRYSEVHPSVVQKRRELDEYLASRKNAPPPEPGAVAVDPQVKALRDEIDSTRIQLSGLRGEEESVRKEIRTLEKRIQAVPDVQPKLTALQTEHESARQKYQELSDKVERASESEFLEESLRGERFEIASAAEVPRTPVSPKPLIVHGIGVIIGCLIFIGPMMVRRLLNPLVFSEAGLRGLTDVPVLVSIPRIVTPDYKGQRNRRLIKNIGFSVISAAALAAVLAFLG